MKKLALVTLLALAMTGCGTHVTPTGTLAKTLGPDAQASHKKAAPTPDNAPLSAQEIQQAKALVEKTLNKSMPDNTVKVSGETFSRTALPGMFSFTATQSTVGFAGFPVQMQIAGNVNISTGAVSVESRTPSNK